MKRVYFLLVVVWIVVVLALLAAIAVPSFAGAPNVERTEEEAGKLLGNGPVQQQSGPCGPYCNRPQQTIPTGGSETLVVEEGEQGMVYVVFVPIVLSTQPTTVQPVATAPGIWK